MPSATNPAPKPKFGTSLRACVPAAKSATLTFPDDEDDILSGLGLHNNREPVSVTVDNTGNDDSASEVASTASSRTSRGGRRRRRNRNNKDTNNGNTNGNIAVNNGNFTGVKSSLKASNSIPRMAETKPVRLQIGLNLDVELELKARLQGDISLTLLAEKKHTDRQSPEVKPDTDGLVYNELFFMRLGVLKLRQRWIDHEVSPSLTGALMAALVGGGFVAGFLCSRVLDALPMVMPV